MTLRFLLPIGLAALVLLAILLWVGQSVPEQVRLVVVLATAAAGYMAINIGANDVANNLGPTVGARALPMLAALVLAAACELSGAFLAGGHVVETVANDLLMANAAIAPATLIRVMIAALLAAAIWINLSTFVGTPVSTTHAIVGGLVGAATMAAGLGAVNWSMIAFLGATWIISPLLGAVLAAGLHWLIRQLVTTRADKLAAARTWVPVFSALISAIFAAYLAGRLQPQWHGWPSLLVALGVALLVWGLARPWVYGRAAALDNRKKQVALLFRPPLIAAAAILSFAHGANDVANAVGPLVAILRVIDLSPTDPSLTGAPWIIATGAIGLAIGIVMFGPRVIHTVGIQITRLNEVRAFCVALAAATTLLLASEFGLPISTTHVAVGAVAGLGFLREFLAIRNMLDTAVPVSTQFVDATTLNDTPQEAIARERRSNRRHLVRRLDIARIVAAWLVTLPASAALAVLIFVLLGVAIA